MLPACIHDNVTHQFPKHFGDWPVLAYIMDNVTTPRKDLQQVDKAEYNEELPEISEATKTVLSTSAPSLKLWKDK